MRECLAIVILNITDDARKVLSPSYQPAVLLQEMVCRYLGTLLSIHHSNDILDDGGQSGLLSIRCGQQTGPGWTLIIDITVEIPLGSIELVIVLFDIIVES